MRAALDREASALLTIFAIGCVCLLIAALA
jgi:hypothetical protein